VLDDNQGMFSLSTVCPSCQGRGQVIETPCPSCHGTGKEASTRSVKVRIPAGVEDGQRIRVKGRGQPGEPGAPAGDLYVVCHVGRDPRFTRRGRNLQTTASVTFPEAVLGTKVTVETLDDAVTLKVPAGTQPGAKLRVKGRGVPAAASTRGATPGDLIVTIQVAVPTTLTDEQRACVEALEAALGEPEEQVTAEAEA
jgi:molecular chaperone DnaJ